MLVGETSWENAPSLGDVRDDTAPLRRGMGGPAVEYLQQRLGIPVDGKFGSDTEAAVKAFQAKWLPGRFANGVVGGATMLAIEQHPPTTAAAAARAPTRSPALSVVPSSSTSAASAPPAKVPDKPRIGIGGFPLWQIGIAVAGAALIGTGIYLGVRPPTWLGGAAVPAVVG